MSNVVGKALIEVGADFSKFQNELGKAEGFFSSTLGQWRSQLTSIGTMLSATVTAPILGLAAGVASVTTEWEKQYSIVKNVTAATDEQLATLREAAKEASRAFAVKPTDIAKAQVELGKTGFTPEEIAAATSATIGLARAGGIAVEGATELFAQAKTIWGAKSLEDFVRFSDMVVAAADASTLSVSDIATAMSYAGQSAKQAKMPLGELLSIFAYLSDQGFDAERAGTAIRDVLSDIVGKEDKLKKFGVSVRGANGELLSFANILENISKSKMTEGDIIDLFGVRSAPVVMALSNADLSGYRNPIEESGGATERAAKAQTTNLDRLSSAWQRFLITLGEGTVGKTITIILEKLIVVLERLDRFAGKLDGRFGKFIVTIIGIVAAAGPVLIILGQLLALLAFLATPVGLVTLAIIGIAIAIAALIIWFPEVKAFFKGIWEKAVEMKDKVVEAVTGLKDAFFEKVGAAVSFVKDAFNGVVDFFTELPEKVFGAVGNLLERLYNFGRDMVQGIIDGVQSLAGTLWDKFVDIVTAPYEAAKKLLGVHSPSRLFMELGRNVSLGFAAGITKELGVVNTAAGELAAATSVSFSSNQPRGAVVNLYGDWYGSQSFRDTIASVLDDIARVRR
jgi:TP901 family phage tail tape measure protein